MHNNIDSICVSIILCFLICALQIHWLNYHFLQECKLARITKDQNDIKSLILSITDTLNPFDSELNNNKLYSLMNGVALDPEIAAGLINFYSTGQRWMEEFIEECKARPERFEERLQSRRVKNFAGK